MKKLIVIATLVMSAFAMQANAATMNLTSSATGTSTIQAVLGNYIGNTSFTPAGAVNDIWTLVVGAGESANVTFSAENLKGTFFNFTVNFYNIDPFSVSPALSVANLGAGTYTFNVTGIANGIFGGSYFSGVQVTQTPIPAAVWLFGSALMGLVGAKRRKVAA